jgi:8-oxo-dGTP pyrophosphatase MutT (NUDIX family)
VTQLNDRVAAGPFPRVRIAAAVIMDDTGRVLLVRKRGSLFFMQPGGKLEDGEAALDTLERELNEELGWTLLQAAPLGIFSAWAANEVGHVVEAALFHVESAGDIKLGAEIEEFVWVQPSDPGALRLAPLTRHHVLPLILSKDLREF